MRCWLHALEAGDSARINRTCRSLRQAGLEPEVFVSREALAAQLCAAQDSVLLDSGGSLAAACRHAPAHSAEFHGPSGHRARGTARFARCGEMERGAGISRWRFRPKALAGSAHSAASDGWPGAGSGATPWGASRSQPGIGPRRGGDCSMRALFAKCIYPRWMRGFAGGCGFCKS